MVFATAMTQGLAKFTNVLDSRHKVPMNTNTYMKAIVPIGLFFSFSLICGNVAYLYLSVSFIQMLKALNAVVTLLATWAFAISPPDMKKLANVSAIVVGVIIASYGEIQFVMTGFLIQLAGIVFEAVRLVMVQRILSAPEFKMDPLVSLYYYAPACAAINGAFTLFIEIPKMQMTDIYNVGMVTLLLNALVAFGLNVSVVFLVSIAKEGSFRSTTNSCRLAKPRLLSSPFQVCSRTSCWSSRRCSSSTIRFRPFSSSATPLLLLVWSTTSLAPME